jgi:NADH-quinone oxidoreductase subunit H
MLDWLKDLFFTIVTTPWLYITIIVHGAVLGAVAYLILLERKVASWVQDRIGPNRVGLGGLVPLLLLPLAPFIDVDKIADKVRSKHMFGLGQPLADGLKFILKEDYQPKGVDRILFSVAPVLMIVTVIISIAVIPWGGMRQTSKAIQFDKDRYTVEKAAAAEMPVSATLVKYDPPVAQPGSFIASTTITYRWPFQIANLNIGVLFIIAFLSLAVYGVVVGGWASNNKYSFLGGLRATANMISYEIPLGLSILAVCSMFGTFDLGVIVSKQASYWAGVIPAWNVFCQPVAFFLFLVCIHAEANRAPFDTAEAEQELVGGYHTEYSSMRFALFFLAEYAGMITTSAVCVALFFGGWHIPWVDKIWPNFFGDPNSANPEISTYFLANVIRAGVFFGKTMGIIFVFMWVRWSLPRFRFDQIMNLAWRALIPISLALFMVTSVIVYIWGPHYADYMRVSGSMAIALLASSAGLTIVTMLVSVIIPPAPATNRKIAIPNSRFAHATPRPRRTTAAALNRAAVESVAVGDAAVSGRVGT